MPSVAITAVSAVRPRHWSSTEEAAEQIGARTGDSRRVMAIARGSRIERRATAVPAFEIARLGSIAERNAIYRRVAPELALEAGRGAVADNPSAAIGYLTSSSCTGYMVPGWDVTLAERMGLAPDVVRVPITQAGCSGGLLALARAADYVRLHPERSALAVSVELCSLAFHAVNEPGNLVSALLFGDGAGAALVEANTSAGLHVLDSSSLLIPCSSDAIGFDLTDHGFYPRLALDLSDMLVQPTVSAVEHLLTRAGLRLGDLSFALLHPGGPRILDQLLMALGMPETAARWSYDSLREQGNTSSAAIFDVLHRYQEDQTAPRGYGLVAAFGPGVSIELMLAHAC